MVLYVRPHGEGMQPAAGTLQGAVWPISHEHAKLQSMLRKSTFAITTIIALISIAALTQTAAAPSTAPEYTADGKMKLPENYREWIYLSTGLDMSYTPDGMAGMDHHMFDNVFVNPEAYKAFKATGTWPDKTMMVLEVRRAQSKGSINQHGNFQTDELMGLEVHVKDEARFPGKWAFFGFDEGKSAKMIPTAAACYSCHAEHAAVDTTFVQFYPTLLPIAKAKGTMK